MVKVFAALATFVAAVSASAISERQYTGGPFSGSGTYYEVGLGACGISNVDSQYVVAISHILYDSYPGYTGTNPNNNPVCGKYITATYNGASVRAEVVDRCVGCAEYDIDFSPSAFTALAPESVGRMTISWSWS